MMTPPPFPDPEFYDRETDSYLFVASYTTPYGSRCMIEIWAEDMENAEEHVEMMRRTMRLDGQVYRKEEMKTGEDE